MKKPWSDFHQRKYVQLYNYLVKNNYKPNKDTYISDMKRKLATIIEKNDKWGQSCKMHMDFTIARFLFNINNNDKNIKFYQQLGFNLKQAIDKKTSQNELDDKEKENYREYDYFKNILDNMPTDAPTIREHYKKLFLACQILHPPIRTSFFTTASLLDKLADNNNENNFVYINRRGKGTVDFIINDDKASNYKTYKKNKHLNVIKVEDPVLVKMIIDSFKTYPRTYLFENMQTNEPYGDNALLKILREITKLPNITNQIMRSIYITWFYKHNQTYEQKDKLAKQMRHSVNTAGKNYLKVFDDVEPLTENELKLENDKLKNEILDIKAQIPHINIDDDKLYKKRRGDIIYRYNKKNVSPNEKTLTKYNIVFDDIRKLYL